VRTVEVPQSARDPLRMLRTTFRFRCPACGDGRLFEGLYRVRATCPACGVRFERNPGTWTGPVVIGYAVGALAALLSGFLLWWAFGVFTGLRPLMLLAGFATALLAYRPIKAWWIWLLWSTGLVFRDEEG